MITFYLSGLTPFVIVALLQSYFLKSGIANLSPTTTCIMSGGAFGLRKMPSEILLIGLFWPILTIKKIMEWLDYTNERRAPTAPFGKIHSKGGLVDQSKES